MLELRHSLNRLRHAWGFTAFAVLTLAIGIGATTAVYSLAYALLFRAPDIRDVQRVVNIYHSNSTAARHESVLSWPDVRDLLAAQTVFEDVMEWAAFTDAISTPTDFQMVLGELVSGNYFTFVGAQPLIGRALKDADDTSANVCVAVISESDWRRHFDADPSVVGRTLTLKGHRFEIVGVMPTSFRGVNLPNVMPTSVWVPLHAASILIGDGQHTQVSSDRERRWVSLKARLRPGQTLASAQAELTEISESLNRTSPIGRDRLASATSPSRHRDFRVVMASSVHMAEAADVLAVPLGRGVLACVVLALLVACTNLANLMFARGARTRCEMALRAALGASRWHLLMPLAMDRTILGVMGGTGGLGLAWLVTHVLSPTIAVGPGMSIAIHPRLEPSVLLVALLSTLGSVIVFGILPAWHGTNVDTRRIIDGNASGIAPRWRGRRFLIVAQVAISATLLALGAVFARAAVADARHDPGFDLDRLAVAQVDFAHAPRVFPDGGSHVLEGVLWRVREDPHIESASVVSRLPVYFGSPDGYPLVGAEPLSASAGKPVDMSKVTNCLRGTEDVLSTLGIPLLEGRSFRADDLLTGTPPAIVSRSVALRAYGTTSVVGRTLYVGTESHTVIGIVGDTDFDYIGRRGRGWVYLPLQLNTVRGSAIIAARTRGALPGAGAWLQSQLLGVHAGMPIMEVTTGRDIRNQQTLPNRVAADVTLLLGGFTLVLALIGLSGLLAYFVSIRRKEIGIRMALGATPANVLRMIVADGFLPVFIGSATGFVVGGLLTAAVGLVWFSETRLDIRALACVPLVLWPAATFACYLPARRAVVADPSVSLRDP
jgi:putative ABC transport system permease protein